jgi:hypothetical protein
MTWLIVLVFVVAGLLTSRSRAQEALSVPDLGQRMRAELTSDKPCALTVKDALARAILGLLPPGQKDTSVRPSTDPCQALVKRLGELSENERADLGRALAGDGDAAVSSLGANLLFTQGLVDEAVPPLAAKIAGGEAGRMYFAPSRLGDETLWLRMTIKISRYLLEHLDQYPGSARSNVEQYLYFWTSLSPFSRSETERRIAAAEGTLKK